MSSVVGCADGGPIFTADSDTIEVGRYNFFEGAYRWKRQRTQLTPKQLELAEDIKEVDDSDDCWEDAVELSVTVTTGGTQRTYAANPYRGTCGDDITLVDFDAVNALLGTVNCLSSKSYHASSPESAPSIIPNDGCRHGLINGQGTATWWFRLQLPAAGEYRISFEECAKRVLRADLVDGDVVTELDSAAGTGKCPTLVHTFSDAGSYPLRVQLTEPSTLAGDFFMAVESNP